MPKHTHAPRSPRPGFAGSVALCGRAVGHRGITAPEAATCPQCRAKLDAAGVR